MHREVEETPETLLLDIVECAHSHTGANLAVRFEKVLKDFGITVQGGNPHPVHRCLTSEPLAGRPKSRRESGPNMPILQFLVFGHLFQFLDTILVDKCPSSKGKSRLNIQKLASLAIPISSWIPGMYCVSECMW